MDPSIDVVFFNGWDGRNGLSVNRPRVDRLGWTEGVTSLEVPLLRFSDEPS